MAVADHTELAPTLTAVAAICTAVVWPVLIGLILWWFREPAAELLRAAVTVAEGSTRFKIWQIEFDRDVQQQLSRSETAAMVLPVVAPAPAEPSPAANAATQAAAAIPPTEVRAAAGVRTLLESAPNSTLRKAAENAIKSRMLGFAQEYDTVRASRHAGADRTRAMNAVVAKMRTLALAADFLLDELESAADSPGKRLAAICILQMKPDLQAVPWLVERMKAEQPFVFFHASVALLNTVRRYGLSQKAALGAALQTALAQVQSFGEKADANTVRLLTLAQSELEPDA